MTFVGAEESLPQPGATIAEQYRIDELLGQGGMGAVFAGEHLRTGRAIAIKWMLPQAATNPEAVERFIAEARATARIEHPNVVHIYDFGQDLGSPFLVMERLRGESLRQRLDREGRLSPADAMRVLLPALRGVDEAHREGIVHRDLKPDNIFLCRGKDGSEREAKVVDFGISKLYDDGTRSSLTGTGMMMGTPAYMSPEQLNAPKEADARFDVYALGVVFYEALAGRTPYQAQGIFQLVAQIMNADPLPIRQLAPDCPADLEAAVLRAMHRDPEQRFASVAELVAAVEHAQRRLVGSSPGLGPAPASTPPPPMAGGPATAAFGGAPAAPIPATAVHQTPGEAAPGVSPTAAMSATPGAGVAPTAAMPSEPPRPRHATAVLPAGSQPGVHPGAVGANPMSYRPHAAPRRRSGGTVVVLGLAALLLGATSAGTGWYFVLGPGAPVDEAEVAGSGDASGGTSPSEAIGAGTAEPSGASEPSAVATATADGDGRRVENATDDGADAHDATGDDADAEDATDDDATDDATDDGADAHDAAGDDANTHDATDDDADAQDATDDDTNRGDRRRRRRRRRPRPAPEPVVRPVAPTPSPRPTPARPSTERGANGALIIE
ncbi:MAG TPA: serine/threonine-protein kinase [Sandaracinaceae bacterium LLY-WYZ-13_1]|nr:serine/threonine-protein kinase [Sandaracinaceae bacterium LLY-WYZ-13_1]